MYTLPTARKLQFPAALMYLSYNFLEFYPYQNKRTPLPLPMTMFDLKSMYAR